jgi:uncharacterized membrane protein
MRCLWAVLAVVLVLPALVPAEDKKEEKATTFSKDVKPIVQDKCVGCHKGAKAKGGLDMTSLEGINKGSKKTKKVVVPSKPGESQFYLVLTEEGKPHMPPKSSKKRPTEEEIATIKKWIAGGAKE